MTTTETTRTISRPDWLSEEVWPFQVRTIDLDGIPIAYTDEGDGPTLLLVHDGMWSYVWGQVIERLSGTFRVVTLDFPGSGLSPDSDRPVTLESDSELLESFVDKLGLKRFTLVAHDLGGAVGIGLAARRPNLVEGMVLTNTFAWPPHVRSLRVMLETMGSSFMTGLDATTNLIPRLSAGNFGVGRRLDRVGRTAFIGPFREKGPRRRFHQLMASVMEESDYLMGLERALSTTLAGKPVLTIYGERNDLFGFQARFKEHFPDGEEMIVPKGLHFPMCDDPQGFAERVSRWHKASLT
jgi:haloalkane dehalogenase